MAGTGVMAAPCQLTCRAMQGHAAVVFQATYFAVTGLDVKKKLLQWPQTVQPRGAVLTERPCAARAPHHQHGVQPERSVLARVTMPRQPSSPACMSTSYEGDTLNPSP